MKKDKNFITEYQLFATIVLSIVGVGIFSYPSRSAKEIGTDGWIVTIIAGAIAYLLLYSIYKIEEINNYKDFITLLKENFGKVFSKIIVIIFIFFNILVVSIGMRVFVEVLKMYLLEKTPSEFIILTMIITGTIIIRCGLKDIIRFNEICFPIIFIPMILILLILLNHLDFNKILPLLQGKPLEYLKSITLTTFVFEGFEIAYLVIPHVKKKSKIPKVMFISIAFIVLFYIAVTLICLAIFGLSQTKALIWPTISMIKSISIPGYFIEQWEGIVMIFWIMFYITTFVNLYFFSCILLRDTFNLGDIKLTPVILTPFIYIICMYPENLGQVYKWYKFISIMVPTFTIIVLVLMLLIISLMKRRDKK